MTGEHHGPVREAGNFGVLNWLLVYCLAGVAHRLYSRGEIKNFSGTIQYVFEPGKRLLYRSKLRFLDISNRMQWVVRLK